MTTRKRSLHVARSQWKLSKDHPEVLQALANDAMSPLFLATVEAVEEAVYNSLTRATTVAGRDGHVAEAIPIERLSELLR